MKVFKYPINQGIIYLPVSAKILHTGLHKGELFVWVLVEFPEIEDSVPSLYAAHTGEVLPPLHGPYRNYYGTFEEANGEVLHIFKY